MLLQIQPYNIRIIYTPGKDVVVADAFSRAVSGSQEDDLITQEIELYVHAFEKYLLISDKKKEIFKEQTKNDPSLTIVRKYVSQGWPASKSQVPEEGRPYWNVRDEISEFKGLLLKSEQIIVPRNMRREMLDIIHEGHLGIEKSKSRARKILFWPQMTQHIEDKVRKCAICTIYSRRNLKEPMIPHEIPTKPWEKVGVDVMHFNNKDYVVVVDYFSKFPEMMLIIDKTAKVLADSLKAIFARYGIPKVIMSDNMPFNSKHFRKFASEWDIELITSSPTYAQSNGMVERTIQTIKNLLRKSYHENKDPYISLLNYRTTPITGLEVSPAELLMGREIRTKTPVFIGKKKDQDYDLIHKKLWENQQRQKFYYDRGTKPLQALSFGDKVYLRTGKTWRKEAVIRGQADAPRSYFVDDGINIVRRNRIEVKPAPKSEMQMDFTRRMNDKSVSKKLVKISNNNDEEKITTNQQENYVTRSGRISKAPIRFGSSHV